MNLDMGAIEISKVVRLGKSEAGQTKRRPIRFTVSQFDHKRQILKANDLLRKSEDGVYSNIYFTPDLTKIKENRHMNYGWREGQEKIVGTGTSK